MKVIFINTVFGDCLLSENIGPAIHSAKCLYCVVANDDLAPSTSSQIVGQIEVIKEVLLQGVLKLNDSVKNQEQGDQTQCFPNKYYRKGKWICY